jgi:hypothetical protein
VQLHVLVLDVVLLIVMLRWLLIETLRVLLIAMLRVLLIAMLRVLLPPLHARLRRRRRVRLGTRRALPLKEPLKLRRLVRLQQQQLPQPLPPVVPVLRGRHRMSAGGGRGRAR